MLTLLPAQLLALLQIADTGFPSGAFAHSHGLESYVQRQLVTDAESLRELLAAQLHYGLATFDMVICKEAALAAEAGDLERIKALDQFLTAAICEVELRRASEEIGRRLVRSGRALLTLPDAALVGNVVAAYDDAIQTGTLRGHYAVCLGVLGQALGIAILPLLLAQAYLFVAGQVSAAVRLVPLGQTDALRTIRSLNPVMEAAATQVATASTLSSVHSFLPGVQIHSMQHRYLERRLFIT